MRIIGNIFWLLLGGFEAAMGYFTASVALFCTIIGIPSALQTFKLGLLCLWPFGAKIKNGVGPSGCLCFFLNVIWLIFGGLFAFLVHVFFGLLLAITIIGIPWAKQHFKLARLAFSPFGKTVNLKI